MRDTRSYKHRCENDPDFKRKNRERVVAQRQKNARLLKEERGGACEICGYNKCMAALEWHHLDPAEKDPGVLGTSYGLDKQREETKKCILLCANCHREAHHDS